MPIRPLILGADNPILRTRSTAIKKIDTSIKKLIKNLKDSVEKYSGLGLAAPQIGLNQRAIIVHLNHGTDQAIWLPMINPEITFFSATTLIAEEGCLSLPDVYLQVERAKEITVEFLNTKGQKQTLTLQDLNARVVQHEVDHLNGILIVDKGTKN